jgi:hypothetical protein
MTLAAKLPFDTENGPHVFGLGVRILPDHKGFDDYIFTM